MTRSTCSACTVSAASSVPADRRVQQPGAGWPGYVADWVTAGMVAAADYSIASQVWVQAKAVLTTIVWSGVVSFIAYKVVDLTIGPARLGRRRARRPGHHVPRRNGLQPLSGSPVAVTIAATGFQCESLPWIFGPLRWAFFLPGAMAWPSGLANIRTRAVQKIQRCPATRRFTMPDHVRCRAPIPDRCRSPGGCPRHAAAHPRRRHQGFPWAVVCKARCWRRRRLPASSATNPASWWSPCAQARRWPNWKPCWREQGQCLPFEPPRLRRRCGERSDRRWHGGRRPVRPGARHRRRGARLRAGLWTDQRPGRGADLRRPGHEERGRLRRVAPDGGAWARWA
jgi:hypothetical protein